MTYGTIYPLTILYVRGNQNRKAVEKAGIMNFLCFGHLIIKLTCLTHLCFRVCPAAGLSDLLMVSLMALLSVVSSPDQCESKSCSSHILVVECL